MCVTCGWIIGSCVSHKVEQVQQISAKKTRAHTCQASLGSRRCLEVSLLEAEERGVAPHVDTGTHSAVSVQEKVETHREVGTV